MLRTPQRCTAEAEELGRVLQASLATRRRGGASGILDRTGLVLASKDPAALRATPALRRLPAAARPCHRRRAAVRAAVSRTRAVGERRVRRAPSGRMVPRAHSRRERPPHRWRWRWAWRPTASWRRSSPPPGPARRRKLMPLPTMASCSRNHASPSELVEAGVLPDSAAASSAFHIPVRDPGGNAMAGHAAGTRSGGASTDAGGGAGDRGARSGGWVRDGTASSPTPYRSYRGTEVDRRVALAAWPTTWASSPRSATTEAFVALRYFWISAAVLGIFIIAFAGCGADVGDLARPPAAAVRPPAAPRRVYAGTPDQRRRNGDDLPRAPRAAEAPDRDQDSEKARRDRRIPAPVRARGAGREPALPPEHRAGLRLRTHPRRAALLRDGVPRRRDARRARGALGAGPAGARRSTSCARSAPRCARRTCTAWSIATSSRRT